MAEELFDEAESYDALLDRGLRLSGEHKAYFIEGRLDALARRLPAGFEPGRILDFGCGTGDTSAAFADRYPAAAVTGVDVAAKALAHAQEHFGRAGRVAFTALDHLDGDATFDLCYSNGAFHHIDPAERAGVVAELRGRLRPGGIMALFENNPLNPGTRMIMRRVPFDRDAKTLRAGTAMALLRAGGFEIVGRPRYLFVFPKALRALRLAETTLEPLPLGGQYLVLARRP
jgi:SAM-dependent methyltransferase